MGFPKEGRAGRCGALAIRLTFSMSVRTLDTSTDSRVRFYHGPSFRDAASVATPEELPSFHEWDQASLSLHRISLAFRTMTYRLALLRP